MTQYIRKGETELDVRAVSDRLEMPFTLETMQRIVPSEREPIPGRGKKDPFSKHYASLADLAEDIEAGIPDLGDISSPLPRGELRIFPVTGSYIVTVKREYGEAVPVLAEIEFDGEDNKTNGIEYFKMFGE